jgi:hypothetical protein
VRFTQTTVEAEQGKIDFAERAAVHFAANRDHSTFGNIKPGIYLAIRWGLGDDCVLVLKLDEDFDPIIFANIIKQTEAA